VKVTAQEIWRSVSTIREQAPLVHNITNYVVMNTTANALLALGASPVMAHAVDEVEDMVDIASALVINIGTLSRDWVVAMHRAAKRAGERGIPVILDPVGAGATRYRTETSHELLAACPPAILRGNASEIMAVAREEGTTKGVDSTNSSQTAVRAAEKIAREYKSVVCISGAEDYIISDTDTAVVKNGHAMMTRVTGLGCTASALCGAFAAVNSDYVCAAAEAMAVMGIAGEMAVREATGPASLQTLFLDALYNLSEEDIAHYFIGE